jgi:hypothetical protein
VAHAGGAKSLFTMLGTAGLQAGSVVGLISGFSATSTLATHQVCVTPRSGSSKLAA